jgi:hypothetical protein
MSQYWNGCGEKFAVRTLRDKQDENELVRQTSKEEEKDKGFRRMFCSHILAMELDAAHHGNHKATAISSLLNLLIKDYKGRKEDKGEPIAFEYFLSYLKISSRPFIVFDKIVKESVFDVQLLLTESILNNEQINMIIESTNKSYLKSSKELFSELIDQIVRVDFSAEQKMDLLMLLVKQLTEMKSNYFIRISNIQKVAKFVEKYDEKSKKKFYKQYLQQTKKLLGVSSDTSKSAWFHCELQSLDNTLGLPEDVFGNLVLENTRAYYDGIEKLCNNLRPNNLVSQYLCRERWYGTEYHYYDEYYKNREFGELCDSEIIQFIERTFRKGKEDVPDRERDNLIKLKPIESFELYFKKVKTRHESEQNNKRIKAMVNELTKELKKAQYRDFNAILTGRDDGKGKIDIDVMISLMASVQLMRLCKSHKESAEQKSKIEQVCFNIASLMEKILQARNVKIILECPLECDEWEDNIRCEYNKIVEKYSGHKHELFMNLLNKKEYLEIADSGVEQDIIEEVEVEVANRLMKYRENQTEECGYYVNSNDGYLIWEMGKSTDKRSLFVYAQFYKLNLPQDWQRIRSLLCMNYLLNSSVFNFKEIDYLFELILADKERLMYNLDKVHSHTAATVKSTQCELVRTEKEEVEGCYRSFVLTLLSDLQVSQVYRHSLKESYYCRKIGIYQRKCRDIFDVFYQGNQLIATNQQSTSGDIYLNIRIAFQQNGIDEKELSKDDELLSYGEANGGNEVFLLILALIMNAAGPNRGVVESIGQEKAINVYLSKTTEGCLRIANKCKDIPEDVQKINKELCFPPQRDKGISLWSVSRYVRGLISVLLCERLEKVKKSLPELNDNEIEQELRQLKDHIERLLGKEFYVKTDIRECRDGIKYFYMDIPILWEKYKDLFGTERREE